MWSRVRNRSYASKVYRGWILNVIDAVPMVIALSSWNYAKFLSREVMELDLCFRDDSGIIV